MGLSNNKIKNYQNSNSISTSKGSNNNDATGESKLKKKSTMKVSKTNSMNLINDTEF